MNYRNEKQVLFGGGKAKEMVKEYKYVLSILYTCLTTKK
jgi:hypothetical protein